MLSSLLCLFLRQHYKDLCGLFVRYLKRSICIDFKTYVCMYVRKEMFYLTTHSTHFIYGCMASDIWLRTILIVRKNTRCRHIGYSFRLTARVILCSPSHRHDSTYHGLCYTSRGALAGTRNSSMGSPHEGSIRRPIAPWANALTTELHLAPVCMYACVCMYVCMYVCICMCVSCASKANWGWGHRPPPPHPHQH